MRYILSIAILVLAAYFGISAEPECGVKCNGGWASGTLIKGAAPGKTYVVTNKHVVEAGGAKQIKNDGKVYDSSVKIISETADVAILEVDSHIEGAVALAPADPKPNTKIRVRGFGVRSGGFELRRRGFLSFVRGDQMTTPMFISPGDSGSGIIDDETEELVGVIWGCRMDPNVGGGSGIGLPVSKVKETLMRIPPRKMTYNF